MLYTHIHSVSSVGTVLAFSVFFGLRACQVFVRVSGRVFGPYLLCEKDFHTTRDGWSWHHFEGGDHCEEGAMVDMGLVFCIKVNLWTIQMSVTMVELDMGMSCNTIVGWNIKLICCIIYHCDSFEFQVHNGDHNEVEE